MICQFMLSFFTHDYLYKISVYVQYHVPAKLNRFDLHFYFKAAIHTQSTLQENLLVQKLISF